MSGGSIGTVDLVTGNNVFDMTGGTIVGNLLARGGKDTLTMSGGVIGGNVDLQNGDNVITLSGGGIGVGNFSGVLTDQVRTTGLSLGLTKYLLRLLRRMVLPSSSMQYGAA